MKNKRRKITLYLLLLLLVWISIDINYPFKTDIRKIDATETARLDGAMWRSYYEKKPVKLFLQSAELMRNEFHFPFWRSYLVSYYLAKAAFVFKDGTNRNDYNKTLPHLKKYYSHINNISNISFNADSVAATDLEWWIIRRERDKHTPDEWMQLLAKTSAMIYHLPETKFNEYAHLRVQAMLLRDEKGNNITETDWQQVNKLLLAAWQSFSNAVKK
jgi:hypothetical protein